MKSKLWDVKDDHAILFGMVDTAIGLQFMCLDCCEDLSPNGDLWRLTKGEIVEHGLEPMCDRCGQQFDSDYVNGIEPTYTLPQTDAERDARDYEEAWEEEMLYQHLDHIAENKERERMDF